MKPTEQQGLTGADAYFTGPLLALIDNFKYGDGKGGAFDFSRQAVFLRTTLDCAVPLWIMQLQELKQSSPEGWWGHCKRWAEEASAYLAEHGDALMFKVEGKTATAFNHLAKSIAVLSFCPGGVTFLERHWETR
jgi:hypothetical protein